MDLMLLCAVNLADRPSFLTVYAPTLRPLCAQCTTLPPHAPAHALAPPLVNDPLCALMLSLDVLDVSGTNENDAGFAKVWKSGGGGAEDE